MIRKIDIRRIFAKNFLCFGPKGIEIDFTIQDRIVLIKGENLDNKFPLDSEDESTCSNGAGKSSIQEALVWGLYGKTIKGCLSGSNKLNMNDVINNKIVKVNDKGKPKTLNDTDTCSVEIEFGDHKVIRKRNTKTSTLNLFYSATHDWENAESLTTGTIDGTQKEIEALLGLDYASFVNLIVFTDNNSGSFLEADAATKRKIIQDVLSLEVYNGFAQTAKDSYNEVVRNRKTMASEYDLLLREKDSCVNRKEKVEIQEATWHTTKQAEALRLETDIKKKKSDLQNTDFGTALKKYDESKVELSELEVKLVTLEQTKTKISTEMNVVYAKQTAAREAKDNVSSKIRVLSSEIQAKRKEIESNQSLISSLNSKPDNTSCDKCYGVVKKENFVETISNAQKSIDLLSNEILEIKKQYDESNKNLVECNDRFSKIEEFVKKGEAKSKEINLQITVLQRQVSELSKIQKPEVGVQEKLIEEQILQLEKQLKQKIEEILSESPYARIIKDSIKELEDKESECTAKKLDIECLLEDERYYAWWCAGFGDQGIRKLIINDVIPSLNKKTAHWLQFLIDGKIKITFDDSLDEKIERNPPDGDPFVYHVMSGGERRRLNLAVSQAFAHIMMLSCGYTPSVVFLDEVTTNIDPAGVIGIYKMILELSKEKQVFVTTHDHDLLDMLGGHGKIKLRKQDGITTLVANED